jgi:hypothetical protein
VAPQSRQQQRQSLLLLLLLHWLLQVQMPSA